MEITRESIFVSTLRGVCKIFFSVVAFFLALFFITTIYSIFSPSYVPEEKTKLTILPNLDGKEQLVSLDTPAILRINIDGIIGEPQKLDSQVIENILIDSQRGLLQKSRIKAILLHINTPGGTVIDSDNIYRMLKEHKETHKIPIYAYIDGLCASGGMYVASAADKTYASPSSIIGSVGVVFGPFFNFTDAMNKIGVQSKTLTQGLDKDMFNPFRPWKADEDSSIQTTMVFFYKRFVDIVTSARPRLDKQKLVDEYGAKIYDGPQAQSYGYIDQADAEYKTALRDLMAQAGVDPQKPYQVIQLAPKHNFLEALINGVSPLFTGKVEHTLNLAENKPAFLRDQFSYLFDPGVHE